MSFEKSAESGPTVNDAKSPRRKAFRIGKNWCVRLGLLGFGLNVVVSGGQDLQMGPGALPWLMVATVVGTLFGGVGLASGLLLGFFLLFMHELPDKETTTARVSPRLAGFCAGVSTLAYIGWMGILFPGRGGYGSESFPLQWQIQAFLGSAIVALLVFLFFRSR